MTTQIFNEDCLEGMKKIPDGSVDLICTDPPYCVGTTSNGLKGSWLDNNLILPFFKELFSEWQRVLKDGGHIYINTDWRTYPFLYPLIQNYFVMRNLIVWEHGLMRPGNWYRGSHEFIIFGTKGKSLRNFNCGDRDIWRIKPQVSELCPNRIHQSQKPVELCEKIIKNSSAESETVLDCFAGSGTTAVAAINTGRNFIGFELDEHYFEVSQKRINEALAQKTAGAFLEA